MTNLLENLTFGIESEFIRVSTRELVDHVRSNTSIPMRLERYGHSVPSQWKVTTDQTVSTNYNFSTGEGNGGEVVSPVLKGQRGLEEAEEMFTVINDRIDDNIDRNCGLHVHIGKVGGWSVEEIKKIYKRWIDFEDQIDEFIPRSRRGNSNRWCQSNKTQQRFNTWMERFNGSRVSDLGYNVDTRYTKLNLASLSRQETIEFRHHSGTTNPKKIVTWIKFLVGFIEASLSSSSFDARTYKRQGSRKVHAEIREILETNGWSYKISGNSCKMISPANVTHEFSYDQINSFYDNKTDSFLRNGVATKNTKLNQSFNDLLSSLNIIQCETDTGLYFKQDQETVNYLEQRKRDLS